MEASISDFYSFLSLSCSTDHLIGFTSCSERMAFLAISLMDLSPVFFFNAAEQNSGRVWCITICLRTIVLFNWLRELHVAKVLGNDLAGSDTTKVIFS